MQLRSLLLTHDDDIVEVLRRALTDLGIGAEVYSSSDWALQDLQRQKFDAVIIDCDVDGSSDLLRSIRSTPSSSPQAAAKIAGCSGTDRSCGGPGSRS